ncbi:hypothetical protein AB434_0054 [Heyndrickxia coagulans]|nr:hypothetical protein AB434_0054 [Heyndrickxia coagulans]
MAALLFLFFSFIIKDKRSFFNTGLSFFINKTDFHIVCLPAFKTSDYPAE